MRTAGIYSFNVRSAVAFCLASLVSSLGYLWPFVIDAQTNQRGSINQIFFYAALPIALSLLVIELSNRNLDAKSVALLGVLAALTAALRPFGAGAIGLEPMWFILILSARVFGPAFGFVLGILALFVSAIFTGGFGPWLAYQMFAAGWIGFGAGLLPRTFGRKAMNQSVEIVLLIFYGIFAALLFGLLMDLQFWPWALGSDTQLSYLPGASIGDNFGRFLVFHFATSMAWDVPRAIFTAMLIGLTAKPVLRALRRAQRKASFLSPIEFREKLEVATSHAREQTEL